MTYFKNFWPPLYSGNFWS